jgi:hypothetical protein
VCAQYKVGQFDVNVNVNVNANVGASSSNVFRGAARWLSIVMTQSHKHVGRSNVPVKNAVGVAHVHSVHELRHDVLYRHSGHASIRQQKRLQVHVHPFECQRRDGLLARVRVHNVND